MAVKIHSLWFCMLTVFHYDHVPAFSTYDISLNPPYMTQDIVYALCLVILYLVMKIARAIEALAIFT